MTMKQPWDQMAPGGPGPSPARQLCSALVCSTCSSLFHSTLNWSAKLCSSPRIHLCCFSSSVSASAREIFSLWWEGNVPSLSLRGTDFYRQKSPPEPLVGPSSCK